MTDNTKTTMVIGASDNPARYAYRAVKRLQGAGYNVVALGKRKAMIGDIEVLKEKPLDISIDTITLYLNPLHQKEYYDYILQLMPRRIIFNPGTENEELGLLAEKNGIETLEACTLVMLATGQY